MGEHEFSFDVISGSPARRFFSEQQAAYKAAKPTDKVEFELIVAPFYYPFWHTSFRVGDQVVEFGGNGWRDRFSNRGGPYAFLRSNPFFNRQYKLHGDKIPFFSIGIPMQAKKKDIELFLAAVRADVGKKSVFSLFINNCNSCAFRYLRAASVVDLTALSKTSLLGVELSSLLARQILLEKPELVFGGKLRAYPAMSAAKVRDDYDHRVLEQFAPDYNRWHELSRFRAFIYGLVRGNERETVRAMQNQGSKGTSKHDAFDELPPRMRQLIVNSGRVYKDMLERSRRALSEGRHALDFPFETYGRPVLEFMLENVSAKLISTGKTKSELRSEEEQALVALELNIKEMLAAEQISYLPYLKLVTSYTHLMEYFELFTYSWNRRLLYLGHSLFYGSGARVWGPTLLPKPAIQDWLGRRAATLEKRVTRGRVLDLLVIPTVYRLSPKDWIGLANRNIGVIRVTAGSEAERGLLAPPGTRWTLGLRAKADRLFNTRSYVRKHSLQQNQLETLGRLTDRWQREFDNEVDKISDMSVQAAVRFIYNHFHRDKGLLRTPSSYFGRDLRDRFFARLAIFFMKRSPDGLPFEDVKVSLDRAYMWLDTFWKEREVQEMAFLAK